jgi:hypothetical protein
MGPKCHNAWKRTVYIPFLNHLVEEFETSLVKFLLCMELGRISFIVPAVKPEDDVDAQGSFFQEMRRWNTMWSTRPTSV